jgi:hypothetical protein
MFAHTLEEQKKEPIRQFIYNMLYEWDDLSNVNINEDKQLLDELTILTKECKNCLAKKCPGGYNCKFGVCLRDNKICYNDMIYGKCYNMLMETNNNGTILHKCIHGIHLSEKKLIPYNQRMLSELTNIDSNFLIKHNISFNSKNNIISMNLNDNTIKMVKDLISNKITKNDIINNLKIVNNIFTNSNAFKENNDRNDNNDNDDDIFSDLINGDETKIDKEIKEIECFDIGNGIDNGDDVFYEDSNENNDIIKNKLYDEDNSAFQLNKIKFDKDKLIDNIIIYDDDNINISL